MHRLLAHAQRESRIKLTDAQLREHATEIILNHARDIEFLSISEHLEDLDLGDEDHDEATAAIDALHSQATINISWPAGEPGTPPSLLLDLLRQANSAADLDVADDELLKHHRTKPFIAIIHAAYAAGAATGKPTHGDV